MAQTSLPHPLPPLAAEAALQPVPLPAGHIPAAVVSAPKSGATVPVAPVQVVVAGSSDALVPVEGDPLPIRFDAPAQGSGGAVAPGAPAVSPGPGPMPLAVLQALQVRITQHAQMTVGPGRGSEVTVQLNPPELGRVRITFSGLETQVAAQVLAERADVADQLRRHGEMLASALRDAGFADVNLSFGQGTAGSGADPDAEDAAPHPLPQSAPELMSAPVPGNPGPVNGRLDIRL